MITYKFSVTLQHCNLCTGRWKFKKNCKAWSTLTKLLEILIYRNGLKNSLFLIFTNFILRKKNLFAFFRKCYKESFCPSSRWRFLRKCYIRRLFALLKVDIFLQCKLLRNILFRVVFLHPPLARPAKGLDLNFTFTTNYK